MSPEVMGSNPDIVMNLPGLFILTAIPVVLFALFCSYQEQDLLKIRKSGQRVNRAVELGRVRGVNLFVILFQFVIFFGTSPTRKTHPLPSFLIFGGAILAHLWIQNSIERKIREKAQANFFLQAFRSFFWSTAAGAVYVTALIGSVAVFTGITRWLKTPPLFSLGLLIVGVAVGVVCGLLLTFGLGAFFVRKIFCSRLLGEGDLYERIREDFERSGLKAPPLWIIEVEQFHLGSAMIAGFQGGRGLFSPGIFLSQAAVEQLQDAELRAVVLHEISHLSLAHPRKRFIFSSGLVLCSSLVTGMVVLLSGWLAPAAHAEGFMGCFSIMTCFVLAFKLLGDQTRYHELEADIHAIEKLGGTVESLSEALRKLDRINDELPFRHEPGSFLLGMSHPATERRIRLLQMYFDRKSWPKAPPATGEKPDRAA